MSKVTLTDVPGKIMPWRVHPAFLPLANDDFATKIYDVMSLVHVMWNIHATRYFSTWPIYGGPMAQSQFIAGVGLVKNPKGKVVSASYYIL
ncbi:hypothetical protein SCLCIDRAFT_1216287 [Scleroderma citrinum Foug A]|uniref:Uncharacterized protein n=1 Tax=Scleroderma citrinum Foug A TaxID=1036808 RepID=A0A0C3DJV3_9AGAM|nr:hypothetical protein SCLCIDRAFT_1216287 [Scleroderma citrinum Foug A]